MDSIQVVLAAANPIGTTHLQLDEEVRGIENQLAESEHALAVNSDKKAALRLRPLWAARLTDLVRDVTAFQPAVVQFSGHGQGESGLMMAGVDGRPLSIDGRILSQVLGEFAATTRLVVLNACYSQVQASAIAAVIDCVIGMKDGITDEAARLFAASLYGQLALGSSVGRAFRLALSVMAAHCPDDAAIPCLLCRTGVDADKVFLSAARPPTAHEPEWKALLAPDSPSSTALRQAINKALPRDADLEAFVKDRKDDPRYARVQLEWGSDMQRQRKLNLLFDYGPSERELKADLYAYFS